ncbi:MAG: putative phosphatase, inner rane protein [Xanthobacteraceae bacterium]|nr:putative phosphatase, inner rane protein [Xanthobacteraceae bacterium]
MSAIAQSSVLAFAERPWRRAVAWGAFLGPLFYLTYGGANFLAAARANVPSMVFDWEREIPFLDWTIIPYWSINFFYAASLFLCITKQELDTHARRLLTAQIVAVTCFILFPLRFTFAQPQTDGVAGFLFAALTSFDQPFNQAPSLHIALLVILWAFYVRHVPRWALWPLHVWFGLVGVSVLTTYQHHFIDIPTGALLGFFCLWAWPERGPAPVTLMHWTGDRRRLTLALRYAGGAALAAIAAVLIGGMGLWLLWLAVALLIVALNYAFVGPGGFQKDANGRLSFAAQALLAPYLIGAFINSRAWTRKAPQPVEIRDHVFLGRIPFGREAAEFATVVDLCAELPNAAGATCRSFPMLDLVPPPIETLRQAAQAIEAARRDGPILVCCALGYSRSAAAVATWLLSTGRASSIETAILQVRRARPRIVLGDAHRDAIIEASQP